MELEDTEYDDDIIEDLPEYAPKSEFSKAKQVDAAVTRVLEARGKEMRTGFWNVKLTKDGLPIKSWEPDTRKVFIATVDALRFLMQPEIIRNENFVKREKELKEKIQKLFETYSYQEKTLVMKTNEVKAQIPTWVGNGMKTMPEIGANVIAPDPMNPKRAAQGIGLWDDKVNAYLNGVLIHYDELFGALNELIDNLNYFKQALTYG